MQKEKRNLQDLAGVYVYNTTERESLDRPNEGLITEFSCIEGNAMNCSFCIADQSLSDTHARLLSCTTDLYITLADCVWKAQQLWFYYILCFHSC